MATLRAQFSVRLNPVDHAKIRKIAKEQNRSLANMIDTLVKQEIKRYENKHGEIILTDEDIYTE